MIDLILVVFLVHCSVDMTWGHGRLMDPPSRMSAWRVGFKVPVNYDDNGMNCGSFGTQWGKNGGFCGICGDSWSGKRFYERPNGPMVQHNVITRKYAENSVIPVAVEITKNHLGWNEFRICDVAKSGGIEATQSCLNRTLLEDMSGRSRFNISSSQIGFIYYNLVLPKGLTCEHCVIQWKWKTGSSWGCDEHACGLGHGVVQEEFYGCSDITIWRPSDLSTTKRSTSKVTTRHGMTSRPVTTSRLNLIEANNMAAQMLIGPTERVGLNQEIPLEISGQDYLELLFKIYNANNSSASSP